jgi:hypothetical protein
MIRWLVIGIGDNTRRRVLQTIIATNQTRT